MCKQNTARMHYNNSKFPFMKISVFAIALLTLQLLNAALYAQDFDKSYFTKHLQQNNDADGDAVVLYEKGKVAIENSKEGIVQVYHVHKIIKIIKNNGLENSTAKVVYPTYGKGTTTVKNLTGITYNLADGKLATSKLDKQKTDINKLSNRYSELTFTMPDVKPGSIIDYAYDVAGPAHEWMPAWEFKSRINKVTSEFEIVAPKSYQFKENNGLKIKEVTGADAAENENAAIYHYATTINSGMVKNVWGHHKTGTYKTEPFTTNLENFNEELLLSTTSPAAEKELKDNWDAFNDELWNDAYFGKIVVANDARIQKMVDSLIATDINALGRAKSIYNYVREAFDYNNNPGIFSRRSIDQVFSNRIASAAEINLLMIAMLRMAKVQAVPVILSKTPSAQASSFTPLPGRFNYTICRITADGKDYYLDGSNFCNPFAIIPIYCYNGYARIIDAKGSAAVLSGNDFKDVSGQQIKIYSITDSSFIAEINEQKGKIEATYLRNVIGADTTILSKYVKKRFQMFKGTVAIRKMAIDNLFEPENDLSIKYTFEVKKPKNEPINLNAYSIKLFTTDPFTATERVLPVDFPSRFDYHYNMTVSVPVGFEPKINNPEKVGDLVVKGIQNSNEINYDKANRIITVQSSFSLNRTNFQPEEYGSLRFFFEQMVAEQNATISIGKVGK